MKLLKKLLDWVDPPPPLSQDIVQRLQAWQALPEPDLSQLSISEADMVVVDVETSGFSIRKDHLIAIGACRLNKGKIPLGDTFDIVLKQTQTSSKENILIHRIGQAAQRNGCDPTEALMQFLEFVGKRPLLAFYVGFDQPMLDKALKKYLNIRLKKHPWLDIAFITPLFFPKKAQRHRSLDFWMQLFKIKNINRHRAVADAMATAQVMQVILKTAPSEMTMQKLKEMQAKAMRIHQELHGPK